MIKVFTVNKDGKITLTKSELQDLLNEAYWEGYNKKNNWTTITYPSYPYYTWTSTGTLTTSATTTNATVDANTITNATTSTTATI